MKNSAKWRLAAICVAAAFVQGWILLKVMPPNLFVYIMLYVGLFGEIPFLLLNGVHGDSEGAAGFLGGVLFVIVNASVYYGIARLIFNFIRKRSLAKGNSN